MKGGGYHEIRSSIKINSYKIVNYLKKEGNYYEKE